MKKREPSIELFRLCLMVGICWLHACCQGKFASDFPTNVLGICIPGFVLITGFLVRPFHFPKHCGCIVLWHTHVSLYH